MSNVERLTERFDTDEHVCRILHTKKAGDKWIDTYAIYLEENPLRARLTEVDPGYEKRVTRLEPYTIETTDRQGNVTRARYVDVRCELTVLGVTRDGIGTSEMQNEHSTKSAETDAFRRAARHHGVGAYILDLELIDVWRTEDSWRAKYVKGKQDAEKKMRDLLDGKSNPQESTTTEPPRRTNTPSDLGPGYKKTVVNNPDAISVMSDEPFRAAFTAGGLTVFYGNRELYEASGGGAEITYALLSDGNKRYGRVVRVEHDHNIESTASGLRPGDVIEGGAMITAVSFENGADGPMAVTSVDLATGETTQTTFKAFDLIAILAKKPDAITASEWKERAKSMYAEPMF